MRDARYDLLFDPVKIGPLTAKNRFYQVPHCNGGGYRDPSAAAEMRRVKSEGGWGVILPSKLKFIIHLKSHPSLNFGFGMMLIFRHWQKWPMPFTRMVHWLG
jgi:2,4-dienoyl-CoA reductase-like NADH-dependent reductase (Old Yellow Enzyme family)